MNASGSSSSQLSGRRRVVVKTTKLFRQTYFPEIVKELQDLNPGMEKFRATLKALPMAVERMRQKLLCLNQTKQVGALQGVEVGDRFQYRGEMIVIGLHHQPRDGIDYVGRGVNSRATSIVVTKRYANKINADGTLEYMGVGGNADMKNVVPSRDQKLEGVNLALNNSMEAGHGVRVIFKLSGKANSNDSDDSEDVVVSEDKANMPYVYDGMYRITNMNQFRGDHDKLMFKFTLVRLPNQAPSVVTHATSLG